jgi:hypothetical protein
VRARTRHHKSSGESARLDRVPKSAGKRMEDSVESVSGVLRVRRISSVLVPASLLCNPIQPLCTPQFISHLISSPLYSDYTAASCILPRKPGRSITDFPPTTKLCFRFRRGLTTVGGPVTRIYAACATNKWAGLRPFWRTTRISSIHSHPLVLATSLPRVDHQLDHIRFTSKQRPLRCAHTTAPRHQQRQFPPAPFV